MTDPQEIRRRQDGSIDTGYYMARGRVQRSEAAWEMAGKTARISRGGLTTLAVLATAFSFFRGQG